MIVLPNLGAIFCVLGSCYHIHGGAVLAIASLAAAETWNVRPANFVCAVFRNQLAYIGILRDGAKFDLRPNYHIRGVAYETRDCSS
jgi:hypothetical protein